MSRQADALRLAEELLEDVELTRIPIDRLVMKAARLARLMEDESALTWLGFEMRGCPSTDAGRKHMSRTSRWVGAEKGDGYWISAAAIQTSIESQMQAIKALRLQSISGEYASVALREQRTAIVQLTSLICTLGRILAQVTGMAHDYASRACQELKFSDAQATMFETAQRDVDALLARLGGEALTKIDSINERLRAGDSEAISHAMTTARRLIDAVADAVFPPRQESFRIGDETFAVDDSNSCGNTDAQPGRPGRRARGSTARTARNGTVGAWSPRT